MRKSPRCPDLGIRSQKEGIEQVGPWSEGVSCSDGPAYLVGNSKGGIMVVYVTRNIIARKRCGDGTDRGCKPINPGKYQANKTNDGALEILQDVVEPVYLLPFIWWEKMELGDILIAA